MTTRPLDRLSELARVQEAFADLAARTDPEAPVRFCGDWRVADLVLHLAGVHWWAAGMAVGVVLGGDDPARPRDTQDLDRVYRWAARHLHATLTELPADSRALTLDGRGTASFWHTRQLHETLIHLEDLRSAAHPGGDGTDVQAQVWADAVDEVVDVLHPRQLRLGRATAPTRTVRLVADDVSRTWVLGPGTSSPEVATVTGPARALALLLWRRGTPSDFDVRTDGDPEALADVLGQPLTP
ncbi:hypothetical protein GCM10025865_24960 [Paraoerskovia sediminicola]|uniref:TIGR03083 family protein n=1 Tax=Paraoerskovia sediminicola TaxID=1138587 RepID=A0ABN6XEA2_9CELL|nr:maleylpyruvate isomerase family mycothiol-dependent enzyme [Paraoerskovia sediminicola]BDZ43197.1 hypothetical protein GCM10025865_24960 [Paraoerskovia sediminicola]